MEESVKEFLQRWTSESPSFECTILLELIDRPRVDSDIARQLCKRMQHRGYANDLRAWHALRNCVPVDVQLVEKYLLELDDDSVLERMLALAALSKCGGLSDAALLTVRRQLNDPNECIRLLAIEPLGNRAENPPPILFEWLAGSLKPFELLGILTLLNWFVKGEAQSYLWLPELESPLDALLRHETGAVAALSARLLLHLPLTYERMRRTLIAAAEHHEADDYWDWNHFNPIAKNFLRFEPILKQFEQPRINPIQLLGHCMEDPDFRVRCLAFKALAKLAGEHWPEIEQFEEKFYQLAYDDPHPDVRTVVRLALDRGTLKLKLK